jgi:predicted HTH transcriptional regulator
MTGQRSESIGGLANKINAATLKPNAPEKNTSKIWRTMRALGAFTTNELETISGASRTYILLYVRVLKSAGYLRREHKQKTGTHSGSFWVYRLIRNTGPKTPIVRAVIYDPNLEK